MPKVTTTATQEPPKKSNKTGSKESNGKPAPSKSTNSDKPENGSAEEKSPAPPKKGKAPPVAAREVIYPAPKALMYADGKHLTAAIAKQLLGFGPAHAGATDGVFTIAGEKVFLANNRKNRPLRPVDPLVQEIRRKRWKFNGESIIIGKTGLVEDGQHRLIALLEAAADWAKHPGEWKEFGWEEEPYIECIVVLGIEESDDVVNTLNTGNSRTFADVLFLGKHFAKVKTKDRKNLAKITDYAVRTLWKHTLAKEDPFSPQYRSHAESIDYLDRHPRLIKAAIHVYEENQGDREDTNRLSRYVSLGTAAGLMYLMGCSGTIHENEKNTGYTQVPSCSEKQLDFGNWEQALEFWTLLAGGASQVKALIKAIGDLPDGGTPGERCALIALAWAAFVDGKTITPKTVDLATAIGYEKDQYGASVLAYHPSVGGIDLIGGSRVSEVEEDEEATSEE